MTTQRKGPKAAADILNQLNPDEKSKIMQHIEKCDPSLANEILKELYNIDQLKFITSNMLAEFLKNIPMSDFCLSMRLADEETQLHIMTMLPSRPRAELQEVVSGPGQPKHKVMQAHQKVVALMRLMVANGQLVLKKSGDIYV